MTLFRLRTHAVLSVILVVPTLAWGQDPTLEAPSISINGAVVVAGNFRPDELKKPVFTNVHAAPRFTVLQRMWAALTFWLPRPASPSRRSIGSPADVEPVSRSRTAYRRSLGSVAKTTFEDGEAMSCKSAISTSQAYNLEFSVVIMKPGMVVVASDSRTTYTGFNRIELTVNYTIPDDAPDGDYTCDASGRAWGLEPEQVFDGRRWVSKTTQLYKSAFVVDSKPENRWRKAPDCPTHTCQPATYYEYISEEKWQLSQSENVTLYLNMPGKFIRYEAFGNFVQYCRWAYTTQDVGWHTCYKPAPLAPEPSTVASQCWNPSAPLTSATLALSR